MFNKTFSFYIQIAELGKRKDLLPKNVCQQTNIRSLTTQGRAPDPVINGLYLGGHGGY